MSDATCEDEGCPHYGTPHGHGLSAVVDEYPAWICTPCGERLGRRVPKLATYHHGDRCGWCGELAVTTEPRDFGYPPAPKSRERQP